MRLGLLFGAIVVSLGVTTLAAGPMGRGAAAPDGNRVEVRLADPGSRTGLHVTPRLILEPR